jgi:hypothetical protein
MRVGMLGEVTCVAKPWQIIPMVVTEIQDVIASGQVRPTDQLVGVEQMGQAGTITVIMEPLHEGQLDDLPRGGSCIANAYTSNHDALQDPEHRRLPRLRAARDRRDGAGARDAPANPGDPPAVPDPRSGRALIGTGMRFDDLDDALRKVGALTSFTRRSACIEDGGGQRDEEE